ncbi:hypothetical protein EVAR_93417_1 [Eumeta japonica]|uniref:Uncharacterized protein n=1 Tax=Eumeta variegata TaxID=151549 RepID=A0A4C1UQH5_EUMVA|nr:hypothetical protein EVAR_93417_1 [Eumeta japonica]
MEESGVDNNAGISNEHVVARIKGHSPLTRLCFITAPTQHRPKLRRLLVVHATTASRRPAVHPPTALAFRNRHNVVYNVRPARRQLPSSLTTAHLKNMQSVTSTGVSGILKLPTNALPATSTNAQSERTYQPIQEIE